MIKANGNKYEGTWQNDLKHGNFKVTDKEGKITYKLFQKEQFIKTIPAEDFK